MSTILKSPTNLAGVGLVEGAKCFFACVCVCVEETGQVKNYLGECTLKVTRPDGECSKILVSNPEKLDKTSPAEYIRWWVPTLFYVPSHTDGKECQ